MMWFIRFSKTISVGLKNVLAYAESVLPSTSHESSGFRVPQ